MIQEGTQMTQEIPLVNIVQNFYILKLLNTGSSNGTEKKKRHREGKDEKLAREKGITRFISVNDIINLPMGMFLKCHMENWCQ